MNSEGSTEMSRKEKDELSERKMEEMRLKNMKLMQRYAEVEKDRLMAEKQNSAVTCVNKERNFRSESSDKMKCTREWDKGKLDKVPWLSPNNSEFFKDYHLGYEKREPSSRDFDHYRHENRHETRYENRHETRYENRHENRYENRFENRYENRYENSRPKVRENYKHDTDYYGNNSRTYHSSKKTGNDSYRRQQSSYGKRQNFNQQRTDNPTSYSSHDSSYHVPLKTSLWQNEKVQNKKSRIESWVKSVNNSSIWEDVDSSSKPSRRYSKFKKFDKSASSSDSEENKKIDRSSDKYYRKPSEVPKFNKKAKANSQFNSEYENINKQNQIQSTKDYEKTSDTSKNKVQNEQATSNDCNDPWQNIVQSDIKWSDEEIDEEISVKSSVPNVGDENANEGSAKNSKHKFPDKSW